jgi:Putative Actinobacterial Holin-X, holin superfamily III
MEQPTPSKDALQRLIDGLQTLIKEHLALARVEAKADLQAMGRDLVFGAAGVPPLAVGYLMLMLALGFLGAVWLPTWAAFGIVALLNLAGGGALSWICKRKLQADKVELTASADEFVRNRQWLSTLISETRPSLRNGRDARP